MLQTDQTSNESGASDTPKIFLPAGRLVENTTLKIESNKSSDEENGERKMQTVKDPITVNITNPIGSGSSDLSSKLVATGNHTSVFIQPLKTLEQEELHSLTSINESTKVLQEVMGAIVKGKTSNDVRNFSDDDIHNICAITNQVVNLLKVKNEVLKIAKSLV